MSLPDQLTVARVAAVPAVVILFAWDFPNHAYWATAVFVVAMATDQIDGWLARRRGISSPLGKLLDPVADKVLILAALVMLIGEGVAPAWMVALIVVREILVSGLRLAAVERGVVLGARDLGRLKTWAQAVGGNDRRTCRSRRVERGHRLVGASPRTRGDVDLGTRLRARRAGRAQGRTRVASRARHPGVYGFQSSVRDHRVCDPAGFGLRLDLGPRREHRSSAASSSGDTGGTTSRRTRLRLRNREEAGARRLEGGDHDVSFVERESRDRRRRDLGRERADPHSDAVSQRDDR